MTKPTTIAVLAASRRSLEDMLARAATDNLTGNIYTQILGERALRCAAAPDTPTGSPLKSAPFAIKDNIDLAGVDTSRGRRLEPRPAAESAAIVKTLESLGAIVMGKTNLDEAALGASGRNPRFGRCVNPTFENRLSGGSSSGAAAALAAGHTRFGIGTDTLGSVRIPAAFCGVAGFKPSHGLLPMIGVAPLHPRFDTIGLLGASLSDLATVAVGLLAGGAESAAAGASDVSITVLDEAALLEVDPAIAHTYGQCVQILRETFACRQLPAGSIDWPGSAHAALWEIAHRFASASIRAEAGYPTLDDLGGGLRHLLERALERPAARLATGRMMLSATATQVRACLETAMLLTPTCPHPAPLIDADVPRNVAAFVAPANIAGAPAVCWSQNVGAGAPLSLQLIAPVGADLQLLAVAGRLERGLDRAFQAA